MEYIKIASDLLMMYNRYIKLTWTKRNGNRASK